MFTRTPINRVTFTVLPRGGTGPTSLCAAAGKGESQFPRQLQVVVGRGALSLDLTATGHVRGRYLLPILTPSGLTRLSPCLCCPGEVEDLLS